MPILIFHLMRNMLLLMLLRVVKVSSKDEKLNFFCIISKGGARNFYLGGGGGAQPLNFRKAKRYRGSFFQCFIPLRMLLIPFSERKGYSVENTGNKMLKVCAFVQANQKSAWCKPIKNQPFL